MGLSLDTRINCDVLLINTFITQLPVVFGGIGRICLAGVLDRRFVFSIATFELWLRETIVVFLGMIWGTDRCFVNTTLYSNAVTLQRTVFRFITVAGTWWDDGLFSDFKILWLWLLMIDTMFGTQQDDTFTVFPLKNMWYGCPTWECRSRSSRKRLPVLVVTFLSNGGSNHMMFLFRWRFRFALWDDCNCEGAV